MTETNPLSRYLQPLRRWWPVALGTVVLGLLVSWVALPSPPDEGVPGAADIDPDIHYRATHVLLRGEPTTDTANFDLVVMLARQGEVEAAVEAAVGDRVAPGSVAGVTLEPNADLGTLNITAVQPTPDQATELVNAWAGELTAFFDERALRSQRERLVTVREQLTRIDERARNLQAEIDGLPEESLDRRLLDAEVEVLVSQYGSLQAELQTLSSFEAGAATTFETLQEPVPVSTAAEDGAFAVPADARVRMALGLLASLLLGLGLVFGVDFVDTRIRGREDIESAFGLPVLGELPRRTRRELKQTPLPASTDPSSVEAEVFRSLRLALALAPRWRLGRATPTVDGPVGHATPVSADGPPRTIVVTSARDGEGKSSVVANLAASFAESGQRVLVVDCDFRRSKVADLLAARPGRGLRDLREFRESEFDDLAVETRLANVAMIRSGPPGIAPPWLLAGGERLTRAATSADVVIYDTGPMLVTNEAASLLSSADVTLMVARYGRSSRTEATRTTEHLARLGATVVGVVLVGADRSRRYGYYYQPIRRAADSGEPVWP